MEPIKNKEFYLNHGNRISDKQEHQRRREDFLRYLEETGVINKITGILLDLYENPIVDYPALEYLRMGLVDLNPDIENIKNTKKELQENTLLRDQLLKEKRIVKAKLKKIKHAALVNDQEYNKN